MRRIGIALGVTAIALTGVAMSNARSKPPEIACNADSSKAFSPALTPQQICDRFTRALGGKPGTVRVELRFSPKGVASAKASQLRNGQWTTLPLFEMAVMDRGFNTSDIDRLAGDVKRGMAAAPKTGRN
jgi:hypothetical protein